MDEHPERRTAFPGSLPLIALACLLALAGCMPAAGQRTPLTPAAAPYPTDVSTLSRFIDLPVQPTRVQWQVREKGGGGAAIGPTDIERMAVLQLDQEGLQALQGLLTGQTSPAELFVAGDFLQPWFPEPIQRLFVVDPAQPDLLRLAGARYAATPFAKGGLNNGFVLVAGDLVFIHLHST